MKKILVLIPVMCLVYLSPAFSMLAQGPDDSWYDLTLDQLTAASVPVPATLFLLGACLIGFAGILREKITK